MGGSDLIEEMTRLATILSESDPAALAELLERAERRVAEIQLRPSESHRPQDQATRKLMRSA